MEIFAEMHVVLFVEECENKTGDVSKITQNVSWQSFCETLYAADFFFLALISIRKAAKATGRPASRRLAPSVRIRCASRVPTRLNSSLFVLQNNP